MRLLHFAPERSLYGVFSKMADLEYVPCDLFPGDFCFARDREVIKIDIQDIKIEDESFDVILCSHVLEHVDNDIQAMKELYRVLKSDGMGIFQVPIDMKRTRTYEDFNISSAKERRQAFGQFDHVRLYGRDYVSRLQNVGFEVSLVASRSLVTHADMIKFGLMPNEHLFVCRKPGESLRS
jgi:SAM-dependent methyltransferase